MSRRVAVVIPARSSSTRLPRKHLIEAGGRPFVQWLIERQRAGQQRLGSASPIVVATTDQQSDDELAVVVAASGATCYRGNASNVPARLAAAARSVEAECFVCVDGDDLACSPSAVSAVAALLEHGIEFVVSEGLPFGMNAAGFDCALLEHAVAGAGDRVIETGWSRIVAVPAVRVVLPFTTPDGPPLRLTLDYEADAKLFSRLIELTGERFMTMSDGELLGVVGSHRLSSINASLEREYWEYYHRSVQEELA